VERLQQDLQVRRLDVIQLEVHSATADVRVEATIEVGRDERKALRRTTGRRAYVRIRIESTIGRAADSDAHVASGVATSEVTPPENSHRWP